MQRSTGSTLSIILIALAMLGGVASAGGKRSGSKAAPSRAVAVLALDIQGGATAQIEKLTDESIRHSLEAEDMTAVSHETVKKALRNKPELARCTRSDCLQELAELVGAERFVKLAIESSAGAYTFDIEVLGVDGTWRKGSGTCPVCTVSEASEQIGAAVVDILTRPDEPPASSELVVEILTDPPGARLSIDGKDMGVAPYRGALEAGSHEIVATLDGHEVATMTIDVAADASDVQRFEVKLIAGQAVTPRSRPYRTVKWMGAGAAVGALAWGSVWIAVDGNGTCGGPIETCPEIYNTRTPGLVIAGAGVVIGAATAWMFLRDRSDSRAEVIVAPTSGGAVGGVKLRF